jgi:hypothetical protein
VPKFRTQQIKSNITSLPIGIQLRLHRDEISAYPVNRRLVSISAVLSVFECTEKYVTAGEKWMRPA